MRVGVVMAVLNGERFVAEAVRSVQAQTHSDLRLVIVDDGSTDRTPDLLKGLAASDARIHVIRQDNRGASAARNRAIAACAAEWLFNLDADDLMLPERIARQLAFIAANPEARVVAARAYYINEAGERRRLGRTALPPVTTLEAFRRTVSAGEAIGLCHSTVAFHRASVLAVGGYRPQFRGAEDTDLWARMAEAGHPILAQDLVVGCYRLHAASLMGSEARAMWQQHFWMRECMRARRRGAPEPDLATALATLRAEPFFRRLDRERKLVARTAYRRAGIEASLGRSLRAAQSLAVAALLMPGYTARRLAAQLDPRAPAGPA